ncbi:hypothetical protein Mpsy_2393 [Methanolobus psychrophilus R15]|nr:hypothetical protein Mpsy_2393 [Methanolobus psychrophilus R15]
MITKNTEIESETPATESQTKVTTNVNYTDDIYKHNDKTEKSDRNNTSTTQKSKTFKNGLDRKIVIEIIRTLYNELYKDRPDEELGIHNEIYRKLVKSKAPFHFLYRGDSRNMDGDTPIENLKILYEKYGHLTNEDNKNYIYGNVFQNNINSNINENEKVTLVTESQEKTTKNVDIKDDLPLHHGNVEDKKSIKKKNIKIEKKKFNRKKKTNKIHLFYDVNKKVDILISDKDADCTNELIAWQPGFGKTKKAIDEITKNPDDYYIYITSSHRLLAETEKNILKENPDAKCLIIEGFKRSCHILQDEKNHDYERVLRFYNQNVHPANICIRMGCKNRCKYKEQWSQIRDDKGNLCTNILCTLNHMSLFDFRDFKKVFIDESINANGRYEYRYNHPFAVWALKKLEPNLKQNFYYMILEALQKKHGKIILKYYELLDKMVFDYNKAICKIYKEETDNKLINKLIKVRFSQIGLYLVYRQREFENNLRKVQNKYNPFPKHNNEKDINKSECYRNEALDKKVIGYTYIPPILTEFAEDEDRADYDKAFSDDSKKNAITVTDALNILNKLKEDEIEHCMKIAETANTISISWHQLAMYKQLFEGNDITYMDTTLQFTKSSFIQEIKDFQEIFPEYKQILTYSYTEEKNKNSVVKINFRQGNYKTHIEKYIEKLKPKIKKIIDNHRALHPDDKICILTFKKLITNDETADPYKMYKFMGIDAYWFGGAGGVNAFKGYKKLIVVGTPMPPEDWYQKTWETLYGDAPFPENTDIVDNGMWMLPEDEKLSQMFKETWFGEIYNAVHRVRPLQNDTTIHWFGKNLPEQIVNELSVEVTI